MRQINRLKVRLGGVEGQDELLNLLLEDAAEIICNIRNSNIVEDQYLGVQIRIAIEMYNKMGAEGQVSHSENGLSRTYERGAVSDSLLQMIIPVVSTPSSEVRIIE